eukprot:TRINITY_DN3882_c0_g1_i2.p1 TRINITY_DN3882_c0_g1~~TRINITY_DN3882_c0_g1_i2.p1  ORF type:complete len:305 (-),score=51.63 TRINITY_DN3882_c0_g1_i2:69-983(-)
MSEGRTDGSADPRLGSIIKKGFTGSVVLLGFPHDEGVRRNGGRVGAKNGPKTFRSFLEKMGTVVNPEFSLDLRSIEISDGGDVDPDISLEDAHKELTKTASQILKSGGNDQSYPNARALLEYMNGDSIGVINIDAHLDVRPLKDGKVHSGSPFRLLLSDERFKSSSSKFCEFASQGSQCSKEHWDYVLSHDPMTRIFPLSEVKLKGIEMAFNEALAFLGDNIFVSFDLDSITSADAPGVSCPANIGLVAEDALFICLAAGKNPKVKYFDVSEFNPDVEGYRTGRLVVLMFYYFCMGVAYRKSGG